jgi:hypothetical protein
LPLTGMGRLLLLFTELPRRVLLGNLASGVAYFCPPKSRLVTIVLESVR